MQNLEARDLHAEMLADELYQPLFLILNSLNLLLFHDTDRIRHPDTKEVLEKGINDLNKIIDDSKYKHLREYLDV